jgi:hypothetical protein
MSNQLKQLIKRFEANMLDGDSIDDCDGAMLSAKDCLEYFTDEIKTLLEEFEKEIVPDEQKNKYSDYGIGFKVCLDQIKSNITKFKEKL